MSWWCIHTYPLLSLRTHWYTHTWELRRWNLLCKKKKKYNHSDWWRYQTYKRLDFSSACRYNGPPSTWRILLKCFAKNLRCLSVFHLFGKASGRPTVAKASNLFLKKEFPQHPSLKCQLSLRSLHCCSEKLLLGNICTGMVGRRKAWKYGTF